MASHFLRPQRKTHLIQPTKQRTELAEEGLRFGEAGFPTEVHRTTVGLRWGLLRRVRYDAVDAGKYC